MWWRHQGDGGRVQSDGWRRETVPTTWSNCCTWLSAGAQTDGQEVAHSRSFSWRRCSRVLAGYRRTASDPGAAVRGSELITFARGEVPGYNCGRARVSEAIAAWDDNRNGRVSLRRDHLAYPFMRER